MQAVVSLTNALDSFHPIVLAVNDILAIDTVLGGGRHGENMHIHVFSDPCSKCKHRDYRSIVFYVKETFEEFIAKVQHAEPPSRWLGV